MINIKAEKSYFVYLSAPPGYSFSEGVCNDNVPGHECPHTSASIFAYNYRKKNRFLLRGSDRRRLQRSPPPSDTAGNDVLEPTEDDLELGVTEGRSIKCVAVDRTGMPDGRIDVGVFRFGDVSFAKTKVDLKLDLIRPDVVYRRLQEGNISLHQDNRVLQSEMVQVEGYSYDLTLKDKESIGKVTSEVSVYVLKLYDGTTLSLWILSPTHLSSQQTSTGSSSEFRSTTLKEWSRTRCRFSS